MSQEVTTSEGQARESCINDTNTSNPHPSKHWEWLKRRFWEERSNKVDILQDSPSRNKKRKQSVVDPFVKRFSTRELHGLQTRPVTSTAVSTLDEEPFCDSVDQTLNIESKLSCNNTAKRWSFCTGVLDSKSSFVYYWNCVLALAIFYHLWTIIFRIAFLRKDTITNTIIAFLVFDYITDIIYMLDIAISSRISFLQNGILVQDIKRVALMYLFTRRFYIDILAILPVDLLYIAFGVTPALRLVRLVKVDKLFKMKTDVEFMSSSPALLRASLLVHSMLLLIHWNASFYFLISESEGFGSNEWVYPALNNSFADLSRKYAHSFYWSTLTLTAIGDLPSPRTNLEYFYTICGYLCGVFMFATVVGNIGSIILNRNSNKIVFEKQRDEARIYMEDRKVPKELQARVLLWYDYAYKRGRVNGVDDLNSLNLLPQKMKTELAIHIHLDTLKKVSFLQKCQPEFLHDLLLKMKLAIYTPGDLIIRRGEVAREMYLISDGFVQIIGESGDVLKELGTGDFFGEIGILNLSEGQNRRIADVRSVGFTECFMLIREDVLAATRDYPEAQGILSAYGKERLNRTRKISNIRGGLATSSQTSNKRWSQFQLKDLRESHDNAGYTKTEDEASIQGPTSKTQNNENSGEYNEKVHHESTIGHSQLPSIHNETKSTKNLSNLQSKSQVQEQLGLTEVENMEMKISQEVKSVMKIKEKEISLLNDVIKEFQREKDESKVRIQFLKTKHLNCEKKLQSVEDDCSKLRQENKAKNDTIDQLKNKIEHLQRTGIDIKTQENDVVLTEVNEFERHC